MGSLGGGEATGDDEDLNICGCDFEVGENQSTSRTDELPPAFGGVQQGIDHGKDEEAIDGCDVDFNAGEPTSDVGAASRQRGSEIRWLFTYLACRCLGRSWPQSCGTAGWRTRGRAEMGTVARRDVPSPAGPKTGNMPSLGIITNGRSDLPGPLSQLGLGRDGTCYIVAAGRANHAGRQIWQGITTGNSSFIGIEAENTGKDDDPWPAVQLDVPLL